MRVTSLLIAATLAVVTGAASRAPQTGRVEGRLLFGERPAPNQGVFMWGPDLRREAGANVYVTRETSTDRDGRFFFDDVPPGEARVGQIVPGTAEESRYFLEGSAVKFVVGPGATAVTLGGLGRPVTGTVVWPKDDARFAPSAIRVRIAPRAPPISGGPEALQGWTVHGAWLRSSAGRGRRQVVVPDEKGRFRIEGVPSGAYHVMVYVPKDQAKGSPKDDVGLGGDSFDIPAMPDGRLAEPLDLGRFPRERPSKPSP